MRCYKYSNISASTITLVEANPLTQVTLRTVKNNLLVNKSYVVICHCSLLPIREVRDAK